MWCTTKLINASHPTKNVIMWQIPPSTTPGSWTTILSIIQFQVISAKLWPGQITNPRVMDNNSVKSTMTVRSYSPNKDFGYVCTVTLTLEIQPSFNVMTHPWVIDNNCVNISNMAVMNYGPDTHSFWVCVHCDLDLGDDLRSKSWHNLGSLTRIVGIIIHIQQIVMVRTRILTVCTVTLTLEIWSLVNVTTHPWVMDNNCEKCLDQTRE